MPALLQAPAAPCDKAANIATIRRAAQSAAGAGSEVVVFPELFLTGYNHPGAMADLAEPLDGPSAAEIAAIARAARIGIVVGMPERDGALIYNSALAFDAEGRLSGHYRKIHLFGPVEARVFTPGDRLTVARIGPFTVGLAVCYDIEFPELARALVRAGADLICVPTANMMPFAGAAQTLVPARALENGVAVVYANLAGTEGHLTYTGLSCIVGFDGRDIARAGMGPDPVLLAVPSAAAQVPDTHPMLSTQLRDLREVPLAAAMRGGKRQDRG